MEIYKKYREISELIVCERLGELSSSEQQQLDDWKNESEYNQLVYKRIKKQISGNLSDRKEIDTLESWSNFEKKIKPASKIYLQIIKYAAILLLPTLITTALLNQKDKKQEIAHEITHGSSKAELIVPGGKKYYFFEDNEINVLATENYEIKNEGKKLSYHSKNSDKLTKKDKIQYHQLTIPRGGEYCLELSDGTVVWLNSETTIRFPGRFGKDQRKVILEGEAYFKVKKDTKRPFIVQTNEMETKVLGTTFNTRAYKEDNLCSTTLVEGKVAIKTADKEIILSPGKQALFNKKTKTTNINSVDTNVYTSWISGIFTFENERLEDILTRLERWYDINIFYINPSVKDYRFTGKTKRYQEISSILEMIESLYNVKFEIKGKNVTVRQK